ncbi:hypothetical protein Golax_025462 [Gossypium laxum]|uniref:Uncharacterized protein n=1 Tax=Gossypium laxum TaxID=34288 RepID=A0A7J9B0I8_9ROSI|nr:hypothetical protein [Gossypium laxum]
MLLAGLLTDILIDLLKYESSSFSFCSCLPSGWTILLLSGLSA